MLDTVRRANHPAQTPHAYLPFIAVSPEAQDLGIGSALLQHKLNQLDLAGRPAYLEASNQRSMALYERHGFEPMPHLIQIAGGPMLYPMWRRPVPPPDSRNRTRPAASLYVVEGGREP